MLGRGHRYIPEVQYESTGESREAVTPSPRPQPCLALLVSQGKASTDLLGAMKSHSFVQLVKGGGANSWWEGPDWTLVSIFCISITRNRRGGS